MLRLHSEGMGAQAMASHGGVARQGSMFKLTLSEVQDHLGEPLLSMNLDDLLRNVADDEDASGSAPALAAAGLSRKTVDEVWRDIQRGQAGQPRRHPQPEDADRQPTLGEMTLEDFLMKVGVVAEGWAGGEDQPPPDAGPHHWYQPAPPASLPRQALYGLPRPMPLPLQAAEVGYVDQGCVASPGSPAGGPKRVHAEKTVERRQKRMIKNRESAARSRARKQAYTNELENKVSRLEAENELLKKEQELDRILYSMSIPEPRFQLRRTSSSHL